MGADFDGGWPWWRLILMGVDFDCCDVDFGGGDFDGCWF